MYRNSFSPFRGNVVASFIGALSGLTLLRAGEIDAKLFDLMPKGGPKGKNPKVRSKYIPAGPHRNCGHGFYGMRPVSRTAE